MKQINLLPADGYMVISKSLFNKNDYRIINNLYQPLIGAVATSLYFSLLNDLNNNQIITREMTHYHLTSKMQITINELLLARKMLEGIGLLKTYYKEDNNQYLYLIYAPLSANDYFNHPVLSVLLYSKLGKIEYEKVKALYELPKFNLSKYEDISAKTDEVFEIIKQPMMKQHVSYKDHNSGVLNLNYLLDEMILPKEAMENEELVNLLNNLVFVYNLDSASISNVIKRSFTERGTLSKTMLRKNARDYYQNLHGGELPNVMNRQQPEHLKTKAGDLNRRMKMVYVFENTTPYTFLASKNNYTVPTSRELRIIEALLVEQKLNPGVVNVLIDYVLRTNNNKLNRALIETIAAQWVRLKIETVPRAMEHAETEYKKYNKTNSKKKKVVTPNWFNENQSKEVISDDAEAELTNLLSKY